MDKKNIKKIDFYVESLKTMKNYPKDIFYLGDTTLLEKRKISIVGSRRPTSYTKQIVTEISKKLSQNNIKIVSGAAMGVDAIAHSSAGEDNTIAVTATGLDTRYPAVNKKLIENIENKGLVLSIFKEGTPSFARNFVLRNEVVVALGEVLIVGQADLKSGTMRSVEYALKMGKKIYVIPQRIGDSDGTNQLLEKKQATAIYDVDKFIKEFVGDSCLEKQTDSFLEYCKKTPIYDEVVSEFPSEVFEYELAGKIKIENGKIFIT